MKKLIIFFLPLFLLTFSSCETENPWEEFQPGNGGFGPGGMPGGAPGGQGGATSGALIDLNILSSYQLCSGTTPQGGSLWMNLYEGATSVSGGSSATVKAN